jgi:purine-binding chemotaxis protein CheW
MDKPLAASKKLMQSYLSELLTEDNFEQKAEQKAEETEKLNKLLQSVTVTETNTDNELDTIVSTKSADIKVPEVIVEPEYKLETDIELKAPTIEQNDPTIQLATQDTTENVTKSHSTEYRKGSFQAMFFDVAGLTVAVPLVELGGIHNLTKATPLMGKPDWFSGVMLHREDKINVVDTALWVMPEKYNDELKESINYQFVIMLSNSNWGLQAETLVDTVTLQPEDVKWIEESSKRPWLAGLVKDRMCALLDVEALIKLLNNGINVQQV